VSALGLSLQVFVAAKPSQDCSVRISSIATPPLCPQGRATSALHRLRSGPLLAHLR
jgi:hypothetical protein